MDYGLLTMDFPVAIFPSETSSHRHIHLSHQGLPVRYLTYVGGELSLLSYLLLLHRSSHQRMGTTPWHLVRHQAL